MKRKKDEVERRESARIDKLGAQRVKLPPVPCIEMLEIDYAEPTLTAEELARIIGLERFE
jgi:hypothetical protein